MTDQPVDNPRKQWLRTLQSDFAGIRTDSRSALDPIASAMASGNVWTGGAADVWHTDLTQRQTNLRAAIDRLSDTIDAALRNEPDKVPASLAQSYIRDRRLNRM
jgi:hypothetical protein